MAHSKKSGPVILVGAHKSGTSAFAGVLAALGVNLGDKLLGPDNYNVFGHFEDTEFIQINEMILSKAGGTWHHPPTRLQIRHAAAVLNKEIRALLSKKGRKRNLWGWKDPRTDLTLSVWVSLLPEARLVVCRRNPEDTTKSLVNRDRDNPGYDCTLDYARLLTDYYNDEINSVLFSLPKDRYIEISYEDLLKNTSGTIRKIVNFLKIKPSKSQKKAAVLAVKRK